MGVFCESLLTQLPVRNWKVGGVTASIIELTNKTKDANDQTAALNKNAG